MSLENLNSDNFNEKIRSGATVVDFYADWCGPCKRLTPVLEQIADSNKDINVFKVNVDDCNDIASQYGVRSIPYLVFFKDGEKVSTLTGLCDQNKILTEVDKIRI